MHGAQITADGAAALDAILTETVGEGKLPAFFFGVANRNEVIYYNCKGDKVIDDPGQGPVTADTTVQLFSMTKMVTSIACLQLAEQGKVDFDDAEVINTHLPELVAQPILEGFEGGKATTTQRTQPITLRRLLTHTSGLGYGFLDPVTQQYVAQRRTGPVDGKGTVEGYTLPLRFEPGSHFMYGVGIDWAGILVERLTGQSLDEYFQEHIFRPIGVRGLTFYPTDDIKRDLMQMCGRGPDGKLVPVDGMRPIAKLTPEDIGQLGGGGGLLGTLHNYLLVTQEVLRCLDGHGKILNQQSAEKMFQDALPPRSPDNPVHTDLGKFMGMLGSTVPDQLTGHAITHSLAFAVNTADSPYGRRAGSGAWGGAARTIYWIDPKSGICAVGGTQIFEESREPTVLVANKLETALYKHLKPVAV